MAEETKGDGGATGAAKAKVDDTPVGRFRATGELPAQITAAFLGQLKKKELLQLKKTWGAAPEGESGDQKSRREKRLARVETALAALDQK